MPDRPSDDDPTSQSPVTATPDTTVKGFGAFYDQVKQEVITINPTTLIGQGVAWTTGMIFTVAGFALIFFVKDLTYVQLSTAGLFLAFGIGLVSFLLPGTLMIDKSLDSRCV